jgi:hypothetical protein
MICCQWTTERLLKGGTLEYGNSDPYLGAELLTLIEEYVMWYVHGCCYSVEKWYAYLGQIVVATDLSLTSSGL